jgi:Fe-S cluster biogenesis protein NfuA
VASGASGFANLSISSGVARVRLTGGCRSGGSTFTIANEITPTLKQFRSVRYVKVLDPLGRTARPTGLSDSIPVCLEP